MSAGQTKVQYVGPHAAVELQRPDGSVVTAVRGGSPVAVPTDFADRMLEQVTNWREWTTAPEKKKEA